MTNRQFYDRHTSMIREELRQYGSVEIESGPCAPLTIRNDDDFKIYKHRLWAWLNPHHETGYAASAGL